MLFRRFNESSDLMNNMLGGANEIVCMDKQTYRILQNVMDELEHADKKYAHDPMTHMKVGLKTIQAEVVELDREVERATYATARPEWMRKEATQVAAMSVKFMRDICGVGNGENKRTN